VGVKTAGIRWSTATTATESRGSDGAAPHPRQAACISDSLARVQDCPPPLGWALTTVGWAIAYLIPLALISVWARKCARAA
jgi:hypothetical protein